MFADGIEVVVEPGDEGVVVGLDRSPKTVAGIVQPIADGKIIGDEVPKSLIEIAKHHWIRAAAGIETGDVGGTQPPIPRCNRVLSPADTTHETGVAWGSKSIL